MWSNFINNNINLSLSMDQRYFGMPLPSRLRVYRRPNTFTSLTHTLRTCTGSDILDTRVVQSKSVPFIPQ
ncbi:hypothetical protein M378DRAFT_969611 [Amanita muscaria Koide BX008]|uniref:Uncharacterized protein n=1 Tax=Amanita muscaria (strain Koide BX008) TaxID=946122 RepID=A0A0C2WSW5_AMAMK|nr:hypothetical protein M378DRAFT_969611 [Amanita muscaria Koide BX008]